MVKYWVAGHITGIFEICDNHTNFLYKGSKGAGFSIQRGVVTEIEESEDKKTHIYFNDVEVQDAKISENVLKQYARLMNTKLENLNLNVYHNFEIPLSSGFGASAAGALSLSLCLNDFFDFKLEKEKIFQIAHVAEVEEGGGLGDIIGLYQGGWEVRIKEGAPGIGVTQQLIEDKKYYIATKSFGPLRTKDIIRSKEKKESINQAGKKAIREISATPYVSVFAKNVLSFTEHCGVQTNKVKELIINLKQQSADLNIGQIMLGNGIFVLSTKRKVITDLLNDYTLESLAVNTFRKK